MSRHVLIVHENPDLARLAGRRIKQVLGTPEPFVIRTSNFEEALDNLNEGAEHEWPLIVTGSTVPASPTSGVTPGSHDALIKFMIAVRKKYEMPVVVLMTAQCPQLTALLIEFGNIEIMDCDLHLLEEKARALHQKTPVETSLELELTLKDDDTATWRLRRIGTQEFSDHGSFPIDKLTFDSLVQYSRNLGQCAGEQLMTTFKAIGSHLDRMLFQNGGNKMQRMLFKHLGSVGIEHSRILFTMTPSRHHALVEALREDEESPINNYWMLKTPIVRQYESSGGRRPLYMDARSRGDPVSCLIINADPAEGKIESGPWAARYSALDHIAEEADDIADYLKSVRAEAGIDEIERIDLSLDPAGAQGTLMRVLQRKKWHVVHFAGHAALGTDKAPGIILSAKRGIVLPFREFANELKYTQFLFLSACRSSDPAFLNKAIEYSIPEVIGFMWEVDDLEAARFATSFYQRLFDRTLSTFKSLDHALVAARRSAYDTNPESRIWASPVLLTQPRVNLD